MAASRTALARALSHVSQPARPVYRATSGPLPLGPARPTCRTLFGRAAPPPTATQRFGRAVSTTLIVVAGGAFLVYASDTRAGVHRWLVIPALHLATAADPELGHTFAVKALETGFGPKDWVEDDEVLGFELWGRRFSNPVGLAAGFDKDGRAIDGLFDIGFGYVEVGSVTPEAQPGNPKPRVFRLPSTEAMINRYGFNSEGHRPLVARLRHRVRQYVHHHAQTLPTSLFPAPPAHGSVDVDPVARLLASEQGQDALITDGLALPRSLKPDRVLAINLGKNKRSDPDSIEDYVTGVRALGGYADALVVNVSSPNTPGLRSLQRRGVLEELLTAVVKARDELEAPFKPPVLVKIAPDLTAIELEDVASSAREARIDGIIVSNTTIKRPEIIHQDPSATQIGGLSGQPLKSLALGALSYLYDATEGKIPLIGCGGIKSGQDALDYARAGASFVQLYTALAYEGVGLPRKIKDELTAALKKEGKTWKDVVGSTKVQRQLPPGLRRTSTGASEEAPPGTPEFDADVIRLRQELEEVLANIAANEASSIPPLLPISQPKPLPDEKVDLPIAPSEIIQSTTPLATTDAEPTSGILPDGKPSVVFKRLIGEPEKEEQEGRTRFGKDPLASIGMRPTAGKEGKRLV